MLALCSILSYIYYGQNYAGIIGWSLEKNSNTMLLLRKTLTLPRLTKAAKPSVQFLIQIINNQQSSEAEPYCSWT